MFSRLRTMKPIFAETFFCVRATNNVFEKIQKHFVAATNVSCARERGSIIAETFYAMHPRQRFRFAEALTYLYRANGAGKPKEFKSYLLDKYFFGNILWS